MGSGRALMAIVGAFALGLGGCREPRSPRCNQVCKREASCSKATDPFDENECVAACSALLADDKNAAKVVRHMDCVNSLPTTSCPAVLACP